MADSEALRSLRIWMLFVGNHERSDTYLTFNDLTSITMFSPNDTLVTLIEKAYNNNKTGILKDRCVSAWLIDRLRIGLGWESDLEQLNAAILTTLKNLSEFVDDGITGTTLMICLLECFHSDDLASRSRLLHMMTKCNMQIPFTANGFSVQSNKITKETFLLSHIGCLNYSIDNPNNMVLFFGTDSLSNQGKDTLLLKLFSNICLIPDTDCIRSTSIELIIKQELPEKQMCHVLNVNGSLSLQINNIIALAPYCCTLVISVTLNDLNEDGQLNIVQTLHNCLMSYSEKLVIIVRDVEESMAESVKSQKFWDQYGVPENNRYYLNNLTKKPKPAHNQIRDEIKRHIAKLAKAAANKPKLNLIELQVEILSKRRGEEHIDNSANNWREIQYFVECVRQMLNIQHNHKHKIFPFSAVAETVFSKERQLTDGIRHNRTSEYSVNELETELLEGYIQATKQSASLVVDFFLREVISPSRMYFFERELNLWKLYGEVSRLRKEIAELKNKSTDQETSDLKLQDEVQRKLKILDSIEWGVLDIWREIRIIRSLINDDLGLLNRPQKDELKKKYDILTEGSETLSSITRRFCRLFFSGLTVDALDGTLLNIDYKFISDAFRADICAQEGQIHEQGFFVISVLGTQSTGRPELTNLKCSFYYGCKFCSFLLVVQLEISD